ncbi:MAG: 16S rRNA (guanine(527)-N(7))-methyltransferase RsmG [Phycisphaerae bacterium]|nr:16S rRNA (guanine(527)-N(7))-methyltransferase RsmG [Phycisphaerae bacterium]
MLTESQQEKFNRLSDLLRKENQTHNLTRITDPEEIRQRHFADSLAAVDIINKLAGQIEKPRIIDIGSGAGFPGLALAIAMPQIELSSVEATGKKINFQLQAAGELELHNVTAIHARAEVLAADPRHRERYDFAVSRAVADLAILSELCLPFVEPGGYFLAWKGQKAQQEIDNAKKAIRTLGGEISQITPYTLEENASDSNLQIIVIRKSTPTPKKYPRPYKAIKQKPL